ncbi:hypothetical protein MAPG_03951 [Magnaporthiopsis poae ATCC 64411]|uniref:Uncharacterized protein n=1 Tax=Magnaporthiopsis poae (strain ATCC 64411 / 73-15) TaxID=644358 RepID=A0A0C4DVE7_MAGP6|nr:hypothetical protein MAPG_03951 [Magnaporthiopsis poae ATCC 64411]
MANPHSVTGNALGAAIWGDRQAMRRSDGLKTHEPVVRTHMFSSQATRRKWDASRSVHKVKKVTTSM